MARSRTATLLHRDHLRTVALMNALEERVTAKRRGAPIDPADPEDHGFLAEIASVLAHDVDRHFAFEEGVLFPVIAEAGSHDVVVLLAREHGTIGPMARGLIALVERIGTTGADAAAWADFRRRAAELVDHVLLHIQKEEMTVIERLGDILDADVDKRIAARFTELFSDNG